MRFIKKIILISLIISTSFINISCWNYTDVERLDIVMSFAIDKDMQDNQYILTVEIASPEAGSNQAKNMSELYESRGNTVFEAVRGLISVTGKKAYWAHVKIGILSRAVINEDIASVLDFFYRDIEPRKDIFILVSKRETAKEILEKGHNSQELRTDALEYMMENQKSLPKYPKTELRKLVRNLESPEMALLIPVIDIISEGDKIVPEIKGSAIIKYDKGVGYLSADETQYALWVMGEIKGGVFAVQNIAGTNNDITFEILNNKTKIKSEYKNNNLRMKVKVVTYINIGEIRGNINILKEEEFNKIKTSAEEELKHKLEFIVKKMKSEYKSDIFNFANKVQIENKNLWKSLKSNWDEKFVTLPVDIDVNLVIKGSVISSEPIKGGNEQ